MSSPDKLRQRDPNGIAHVQPIRKFYPAPYISEQTLGETEAPISDTVRIKHNRQGNVCTQRITTDSVIGRELGMYERSYFRQALEGAEIISLMIQLESTVPITEVAVRHAIHNLVERHPLLRMSVARDGDSYFMYDGADNKYDFRTSSRKDWPNVIKEEFDIPFSENGGLLWRIRLLNSSRIERDSPPLQRQNKVHNSSSHATSSSCARQTDVLFNTTSHLHHQASHDEEESDSSFRYQATFLFIFNHAITDGGYTMWLFQEFVNFLDAYNTGVDIGQIKQLPLLPPSECLTSLDGSDETRPTEVDDYVISGSHLQFCHGQGNPDMLSRYKLKYRDEVDSLSARPQRNSFILFHMNKTVTRMLTNASKSNRVKVNTAIVTSSLLAFIDLVYDPSDIESDFEIPFEYMSDTRRDGHLEYEGKDQFLYPGLASLSIPLKARIQLTQRPVSMATFWDISKSFNKAIQTDIQTKETIKLYHEVARKERSAPKTKGKSPFVLCFSNMGKLDGLFNDGVSERFRLVDLLGQSSVLTEDMPIFFVSTYALNGRLCGSVSFCDGFTSENTATTYLALLQKYLTVYSKL